MSQCSVSPLRTLTLGSQVFSFSLGQGPNLLTTLCVDPTPCPTLWVGTSLGSVLTVMITTPVSVEARLTTPVVLQPCGEYIYFL